jgi:hypothetical protein
LTTWYFDAGLTLVIGSMNSAAAGAADAALAVDYQPPRTTEECHPTSVLRSQKAVNHRRSSF